MQARLNALGKEAAKPLALMYVAGVGLAHGKPNMASEDGKGADAKFYRGIGRMLADAHGKAKKAAAAE